MTQPGPGRPRLGPRRRAGQTPRAEILDAAAELFTTKGYASTSTRAIADAVGIRQASLYHYFAAKDDILDALLDLTVTAPLQVAARLAAADEPAEVRLYALARYDVGQLAASRWNLGALYLLPELRAERFDEFRARRTELRGYYEQLAELTVRDGTAPGAPELAFRLVETVINIRSDAGTSPAALEYTIPETVLRMLGWTGSAAEIDRAATVLLAAAAPLPVDQIQLAQVPEHQQ